MRRVELLQQREGLGFVLRGEDGGELGSECRVVRGLGEGGSEESFSFGILLLLHQQMGKPGICLKRSGVVCKITAVGGFGGSSWPDASASWAANSVSSGVSGLTLRACRSSSEATAASPVPPGPGLSICGQSSPGARFEGGTGFARVEGGCGDKLRTRLVELALTGEDQSQGEAGFKGTRICLDCTPVERGGIVEAILVVSDIARVEEGARIVGMGGEPGIKERFGGLPVGLDDGGFGVGDLAREFLVGCGSDQEGPAGVASGWRSGQIPCKRRQAGREESYETRDTSRIF